MLLEKLKLECQRRGLSPRTIQTYAYCVGKFLKRNPNKELKKITKEKVKEYLDQFLDCGNTLNVNLNALKFFFEEVLHKKLTINIHFSKTPKKLPEFLTKEEVIKLFSAIENPKHQLMIELMYGTGMRVSELTKLKVKDFCFENNHGWVRQGKGNKDRPFIIPLRLKERLLEYIWAENFNLEDWLFKGQNQNHYSVSSIQAIIKSAKKKAWIEKNVHPHTLRHSFATHIVQNGYTAMELQPLMGHSKLETTMMYLHMGSPNMLNVKSPLDTLPAKII